MTLSKAQLKYPQSDRRIVSYTSVTLLLTFDLLGACAVSFNPRPPEPFYVTRPPKGGGVVATPSLDFL